MGETAFNSCCAQSSQGKNIFLLTSYGPDFRLSYACLDLEAIDYFYKTCFIQQFVEASSMCLSKYIWLADKGLTCPTQGDQSGAFELSNRYLRLFHAWGHLQHPGTPSMRTASVL